MPDEEMVPKKKMYCGEFGCLILIVLMLVGVLTPTICIQHEASRRASCQNNLKQLGLTFKMYANESPEGFYPPMQTQDCNGKPLAWSKSLDVASLAPEYFSDFEDMLGAFPDILSCPSYYRYEEERNSPSDALWYNSIPPNPDVPQNNPFAINGTIEQCELLETSYTYYSHVVLSNMPSDMISKESIALLASELKGIDVSTKQEELTVLRQDPLEGIRRFKEGVERFHGGDWCPPSAAVRFQSNLVIMHDRIPKDLELAHPPGGVNVLFMDGHVEFVKNDEAGEFVFGPVGEIVQRRW